MAVEFGDEASEVLSHRYVATEPFLIGERGNMCSQRMDQVVQHVAREWALFMVELSQERTMEPGVKGRCKSLV